MAPCVPGADPSRRASDERDSLPVYRSVTRTWDRSLAEGWLCGSTLSSFIRFYGDSSPHTHTAPVYAQPRDRTREGPNDAVSAAWPSGASEPSPFVLHKGKLSPREAQRLCPDAPQVGRCALEGGGP